MTRTQRGKEHLMRSRLFVSRTVKCARARWPNRPKMCFCAKRWRGDGRRITGARRDEIRMKRNCGSVCARLVHTPRNPFLGFTLSLVLSGQAVERYPFEERASPGGGRPGRTETLKKTTVGHFPFCTLVKTQERSQRYSCERLRESPEKRRYHKKKKKITLG